MDVALYVFAPFLVGVVVGAAMTNAKWSQNAKDIQRLESAGRLYKVYRLDPRQGPLEGHEYDYACWLAKNGKLYATVGGE